MSEFVGKELSFAHQVKGLPIAIELQNGNVNALIELLALYLATSDELIDAETNPEIWINLKKQAAKMDPKEAKKITDFFIEQANNSWSD